MKSFGITPPLQHAEKYAMNILMSNDCGTSIGLDSSGKSAMWTSGGKIVVEFDDSSDGLIVCKKDIHGVWSGIIVK